jgi:hypothetical protein
MRAGDRSGGGGEDRAYTAFLAVGLALGVGAFALRPLVDSDAWWNLKAGRYLLDTGRFAGPDPWSEFSTRPFVLTEWAGSVVAALAFEQIGAPALVLLRMAGVLALFLLMLGAARQLAEPPIAAASAVLGLVIASSSLSERPQTLGLVWLMVAVIGWRRAVVSGQPPWWLIPLTWVWASTHGYWVLGIAVGMATGVGRLLDGPSRRRTAWIFGRHLALMLLAAALTPVGPRLLALPLRVHSAAGTLVHEWRPAAVTEIPTGTALLCALVVAWLWLGQPSAWWERCQLVLALAFALTIARLSPAAACLLVPLLASALQRWRAGAAPSRATRWELGAAAAGAGAVVLAGALLAGTFAARQPLSPTSLLPELRRISPGEVVLADYDISSWMLFHVPQASLVVDSRTELFDDDYLSDYVRAMQAKPGWRRFVEHTRAEWAVLREDSPLATALEERSGWQRAAEGDGYLVLVPGAPP